MNEDYYANDYKRAADRLVKALWDLKGLDRNQPETREELDAEARAIIEQLDVAKYYIAEETNKRMGD